METINSSMECVQPFRLYFAVIASQFLMLNSRFLGVLQWHPIASFSLPSHPHVFPSRGALHTLISCRSKLSIPMVSLPLRRKVHRTGLGTIWQGSPQSHCVGRKGSLPIPWPGGLPIPQGKMVLEGSTDSPFLRIALAGRWSFCHLVPCTPAVFE